MQLGRPWLGLNPLMQCGDFALWSGWRKRAGWASHGEDGWTLPRSPLMASSVPDARPQAQGPLWEPHGHLLRRNEVTRLCQQSDPRCGPPDHTEKIQREHLHSCGSHRCTGDFTQEIKQPEGQSLVMMSTVPPGTWWGCNNQLPDMAPGPEGSLAPVRALIFMPWVVSVP